MLKHIALCLLLILPFLTAAQGSQSTKKIEQLLLKEQYEQALKLTNKYLRKDTTLATVYIYRATCYRKQAEYTKAKADVARGLLRDSLNSQAWLELANIFAINKSFDTAFVYYRRALRLNPYNARAYSNMGGVYFTDLQQDSLAQVYLTKGLALDRHDVTIRYNMAIYQHFKGQYQPAIENLNEAIRLSKTCFLAYYCRGLCRYQLGDPKAALNDIKIAMKYNNDGDPFEQLNVSKMYEWMGKCEEARGRSRKARRYFALAAN